MTRHLVLLAFVLLVLPGAAGAQLPADSDPGSSIRTRAELEELLASYEQVLASSAYSERVKGDVRRSMERIQERLRAGDFELGDRVVLYVEGEPSLPDTVAVQSGPKVTLPLFGDISLVGVLRSELESHLTRELTRFIRDPVIRAQALMRMSVQGSVRLPGFYVVPADMLLSEALMVAGGPAPNAKLDDLRIERGTQVVIAGTELQEAMRRGLTLDQLNLQAGDQVVVPAQGSGILGNIGIIAGLLGSLTFLVLQLSR